MLNESGDLDSSSRFFICSWCSEEMKEHGKLPYPEGTACAEVLVATEVGGGQARNVFVALAVGALFKALFGWAKVLPGTVKASIPFLPRGQIGLKLSAALFGVGFILGPRIGAIMVGGGLLSSLIIGSRSLTTMTSGSSRARRVQASST